MAAYPSFQFPSRGASSTTSGPTQTPYGSPPPAPPSSHRSHSRTHSAADASAAMEQYKRQLYQHQQALEQQHHFSRLPPSSSYHHHNHNHNHTRQHSTIHHPSPQTAGTPRLADMSAGRECLGALAGNAAAGSAAGSVGAAGMGICTSSHPAASSGTVGLVPAQEPLSTPSVRETTSYMHTFSLLAEAARRAQMALMVDEMNGITL